MFSSDFFGLLLDDEVSLLVELTPLWLLLAAHLSLGHWPSDDECRTRAVRQAIFIFVKTRSPISAHVDRTKSHGERVESITFGCSKSESPMAAAVAAVAVGTRAVRRAITGNDGGHGMSVLPSISHYFANPHSVGYRLVSHLLVHGSNEHFVMNSMMLCGCIVEKCCSRQWIVQAPGRRRRQREPSILRGARSAVGSTLVMLVGGVVGGVGGLYLEVALRHGGREVRNWFSRGWSALRSLTVAKDHHPLEPVESMWNTATSVLRLDTSFTTVHCYIGFGASAGIMALSGFNAGRSRTPITALSLVVSTAAQFLKESCGGQQSPLVFVGEKESTYTDHVFTGHSGHLGGLAIGYLLGYGYRKLVDEPQAHRLPRGGR